MVQEYDAENHRYTIDGIEIPSVTKIISAMLGCGWMAADWYLQRGRAVHACAALIAQGVDFTYDQQIKGQVAAIRRFFTEVNPRVVNYEEQMFSEKYRFGGTADLICKTGGRWTVIDYKASIDEERAALQLGGYSILAEEKYGIKIMRGFPVAIKDTGKYQMGTTINMRRARREFLALRGTYGVMNRMNILPKENKDDESER